jgi:hypothetical protein
MDIHTLTLHVTESDLNQIIDQYLPAEGPLEDVRLGLLPEGVLVRGSYPTPLGKMSFETLWSLAASGCIVQARLETIKVAGLPARLLRGVLLKTLHDVAGSEPGVRVEGEAVEVDIEQAAEARGVSLRINLTAIRCSAGSLVVEAAPAPERGA